MKDLEKEIPVKLFEAIKKKELVIFVGAGLSWNLINENNQKIEGWDNLVKQLINDLEKKGSKIEHLKILCERKYDPLKILSDIEYDCDVRKDLSKQDIREFTKKFFRLSNLNNYSLHEKLFKLSKKIITTNYDCAFEIAIKDFEDCTAYKGTPFEANIYKDSNAPLLLKLHGCQKHVDSMVLFPSDYVKLYDSNNLDAESTRSVLKNIIAHKSILFIGAGMGDFQINNIFKEIKNLQGDYQQPHFIITTDSKIDSRLDFLKPIKLDDHKFIEDVIDILLKEKEKYDNERTPEVLELEKQNIEANNKINELDNELKQHQTENERMKTLLEREALKYFKRGLNLQVNKNYQDAIEEYKISIELNPNNIRVYNNLGVAFKTLGVLGKNIALLNHALKIYENANNLDTLYLRLYINWGLTFYEIAKLQKNENFYLKALDKFNYVININKKYAGAYDGIGLSYTGLGLLTQNESYFLKAIDAFKEVLELENRVYNLACIFALIKDKYKALEYLEESLEKNEQTIEYIKKDEDWAEYLEDEDFKALLEKYEK